MHTVAEGTCLTLRTVVYEYNLAAVNVEVAAFDFFAAVYINKYGDHHGGVVKPFHVFYTQICLLAIYGFIAGT